MNASIDRQALQAAHPAGLELCKLRSDCIDAFSALEVAAYRLAATLKIETDAKGQLSQLVKKLKAAPPGPQLSKENAGKLKGCCDEVMQLLGQRADIVHSQMAIAATEAGLVALFRNAHAVSAGMPDARAYDEAMLNGLIKHTRTLAAQISQLSNRPKTSQPSPASSPPPP